MADWLIGDAVRYASPPLWHDLSEKIASSGLWLRFGYIMRHDRSSQGKPKIKAFPEAPHG